MNERMNRGGRLNARMNECSGSCERPARGHCPGGGLWVSSNGEPGHQGGKGRGRFKHQGENR